MPSATANHLNWVTGDRGRDDDVATVRDGVGLEGGPIADDVGGKACLLVRGGVLGQSCGSRGDQTKQKCGGKQKFLHGVLLSITG